MTFKLVPVCSHTCFILLTTEALQLPACSHHIHLGSVFDRADLGADPLGGHIPSLLKILQTREAQR